MQISHLFIYPIKSCAAVEVERMDFDAFGPVGDRRYLIVDSDGRFLTQREHTDMAFIRPQLSREGIRLSGSGPRADVEPLDVVYPVSHERTPVIVWRDQMQAVDCGDAAAQWLSGFLGQECRLVCMPPDHDRPVNRANATGIAAGTQVVYADGAPLLVVTEDSVAALTNVAGLDVDVMRFRPNIVIREAGGAFAERGWQSLSTATGAHLQMIWPCERCVVPTRDPLTQQRTPEVMAALKDLCRIDGKIIFGQNAVFSGQSLTVGEVLTLPSGVSD